MSAPKNVRRSWGQRRRYLPNLPPRGSPQWLDVTVFDTYFTTYRGRILLIEVLEMSNGELFRQMYDIVRD